MMSRFVLKCLLVMASGTAIAAPVDEELTALVKRHAEAQGSFDVTTLKAITAENYVEISPVGEVDPREKMLSFYAPEQKRPSPQLKVDEPLVRVFGDSAVIYTRHLVHHGRGRNGAHLCDARRLCGAAQGRQVAAGVSAVHRHTPAEELITAAIPPGLSGRPHIPAQPAACGRRRCARQRWRFSASHRSIGVDPAALGRCSPC